MEDEKEEKLGLPTRFGLKVGVSLDLKNSGTWTNLDNGGKVQSFYWKKVDLKLKDNNKLFSIYSVVCFRIKNHFV
jgi:hypothetical protein